MFTPFNVSSLNKAQKKVAFFDKLAVAFAECPTDSYFTYTQLKDAGVTVADAVLTDSEGNKYRLPTAGELNLLIPRWTDVAMRDDLGNRHWGFYHPWWNDNLSTNDPSNANVMLIIETISEAQKITPPMDIKLLAQSSSAKTIFLAAFA